jgi:hypothetical protein
MMLLLLLVYAANAVGYGDINGGKDHADMFARTRLPEGAVDFFVELDIEQVRGDQE